MIAMFLCRVFSLFTVESAAGLAAEDDAACAREEDRVVESDEVDEVDEVVDVLEVDELDVDVVDVEDDDEVLLVVALAVEGDKIPLKTWTPSDSSWPSSSVVVARAAS